MIQTTVPAVGEGIKIPTTAKTGVVEIKTIVKIETTEIRMTTMGRITDVGEIIAMIVMITTGEIIVSETTVMSGIVRT